MYELNELQEKLDESEYNLQEINKKYSKLSNHLNNTNKQLDIFTNLVLEQASQLVEYSNDLKTKEMLLAVQQQHNVSISNHLNTALKLIAVYRSYINDRELHYDCSCPICKEEINYEEATRKGQDRTDLSPTNTGT